MDRHAPTLSQPALTPAGPVSRPFAVLAARAGSALLTGIALAAAPGLAGSGPALRVMAAPGHPAMAPPAAASWSPVKAIGISALSSTTLAAHATAAETAASPTVFSAAMAANGAPARATFAAVAAAPAAATPSAGRPTPASSQRPTSSTQAATPSSPSAQDAAPSWGPPGWMRASDQRFILMMIPHHDGAIAMADLALTRARHPELRALARRIADSQRRETALMRQWYRQWYGTEVPTLEAGRLKPGSGARAGLGMGPGMGMTTGMDMGLALQGMETSLAALRAAPDFDRAFIEQMIPHHRMGVMMAAHALMGTDHRELRALQQAMVRVQTQEIERMAAWYRRWTGG